ncbi:MAG: hypothetical protein AAF196_18100 [Planctomycetota bacterium]
MKEQTRRELVRALEAQTKALTELARAMAERRQAFLAIDPARSLQQSEELDALASRASEAEGRRAEIANQAFREAGLDRRARWKDLLRKLSPNDSQVLTPVIERTRKAATELRLEAAVGADLLSSSSRAHEGIVRRLVEGASEGPGLYDQRSRSVSVEQGSGRLIDGRV